MLCAARIVLSHALILIGTGVHSAVCEAHRWRFGQYLPRLLPFVSAADGCCVVQVKTRMKDPEVIAAKDATNEKKEVFNPFNILAAPLNRL